MEGWSTRGEVRGQNWEQLREGQLQELLKLFDKRMSRLNDQYLRLMGEHIADIGAMWPSDVHRLQQIRRMNKNLRQIQHRIGVAAERSAEDIERVFEQIANYDIRMAEKILGKPDTYSVSNNTFLRRILQAQQRETVSRMQNLSNTTVVSKYYRNAVDEAVSAVQSGVEDYGTAIRRVIREAGSNGLRIDESGSSQVDYQSGYHRRLDTAVRMNVLDGVRHLNQTVMEEVGREFGANGVEIDAHMLCAEDHLPYQGGQYSNEEFEEIQDSLERPFGEWNCRHSWHPIMLGISPKVYSQEDLERFESYSTEEVTIDERTMTRYQWSQEMRRIESAIRQQKDTATLARYSGDDKLRQKCQGTIMQLNQRYAQVANRAGLKPEYRRTYVAGFKDVNTEPAQIGERARLHTQNSNHVSVHALDLDGFKEKFSGITGASDVDRSIYECAKESLLHRGGTNGEDLYLIDGKTGERICSLTTSTEREGVSYDAATRAAIERAHSEGRTIIAIHNHPNGLPPTLDDGSSALVHGYDKGVAVGHNLEVFVYGKTDKEYSPEFCARIHAGISKITVFNVDFEEEIWYTVLRKYGMEVERR